MRNNIIFRFIPVPETGFVISITVTIKAIMKVISTAICETSLLWVFIPTVIGSKITPNTVGISEVNCQSPWSKYLVSNPNIPADISSIE